MLSGQSRDKLEGNDLADGLVILAHCPLGTGDEGDDAESKKE